MRSAMLARGLPVYGWLALALCFVLGCARPPLCPVGLGNGSEPLICQPLGDQFDTPEQRLPAISPQIAAQPADAAAYCGLAAPECQRRAAAYAPKAVRRAADMAFAAAATHEHRGACLARLQYDLYATQAEGERIAAAAAALEVFYELFLAEQEAIRLDDALAEIVAMEAEIEQAHAQKLAVAFDASSLVRRRLEIDKQRAESVAARAQLNDRLRRLLGDNAEADRPIWPKTDAAVTVETIDRQAATAAALRQRADLRQLRAMLEALDAETLPLVRQTLAQLDGTAPPVVVTLKSMRTDRDLLLRREQLAHVLAERERVATGEVKAAADAVASRLQRVALAERVVASWRERLREMEQLQDLGKATRLELGLARLESLAAETALLREVVAWKTARVKFRTAQGELPLDETVAESPFKPEPPRSLPELDHAAQRKSKPQVSRERSVARHAPVAPAPPPEALPLQQPGSVTAGLTTEPHSRPKVAQAPIAPEPLLETPALQQPDAAQPDRRFGPDLADF